MKVKSFRPVRTSEIPEAPPWVEKLLTPINDQLQDLTTLTQKQVSFSDNLNAEIREAKVLNAVDFELGLQTLRGKPIGVSLIFWDHTEAVTLRYAQILDLKTVRCKVDITTPPSDPVLIRLLIYGS